VAIGDDQGHVKVWSVANQRLLATAFVGEHSPVKKIAVSNDGKFIAVNIGERVVLWSLDDEKQLDAFISDENTLFRFTPDGSRFVICGKGNAIRVWNVYFGKEEYTLYGHVGRVTSIAISPNSRNLVSGGMSGEVYFWDLRIGQELMNFRRHLVPVTLVKFATNGKFLLTGGARELAIWQTRKE
jgi:WD40 repeat protein